jgi:hypothetical protein
MTAATATHETHDPIRVTPRNLYSDLDALREKVATVIAEQPIVATAAAAGLGFVLGSRLARPAMALLLSAAARAAATWIGETIRQSAFAQMEDLRAANASDPHTGGIRS